MYKVDYTEKLKGYIAIKLHVNILQQIF